MPAGEGDGEVESKPKAGAKQGSLKPARKASRNREPRERPDRPGRKRRQPLKRLDRLLLTPPATSGPTESPEGAIRRLRRSDTPRDICRLARRVFEPSSDATSSRSGIDSPGMPVIKSRKPLTRAATGSVCRFEASEARARVPGILLTTRDLTTAPLPGRSLS